MREVTCPPDVEEEDWNGFRLVYLPIAALLKGFQCFNNFKTVLPELSTDFRAFAHGSPHAGCAIEAHEPL